IRERVERLRAENPNLGPEDLSRQLIRATRRRVAGTVALSGAAAVAPGLGTLIALGTATSQGLYAPEPGTELGRRFAVPQSREPVRPRRDRPTGSPGGRSRRSRSLRRPARQASPKRARTRARCRAALRKSTSRMFSFGLCARLLEPKPTPGAITGTPRSVNRY